jgi:hypothetical protein
MPPDDPSWSVLAALEVPQTPAADSTPAAVATAAPAGSPASLVPPQSRSRLLASPDTTSTAALAEIEALLLDYSEFAVIFNASTERSGAWIDQLTALAADTVAIEKLRAGSRAPRQSCTTTCGRRAARAATAWAWARAAPGARMPSRISSGWSVVTHVVWLLAPTRTETDRRRLSSHARSDKFADTRAAGRRGVSMDCQPA